LYFELFVNVFVLRTENKFFDKYSPSFFYVHRQRRGGKYIWVFLGETNKEKRELFSGEKKHEGHSKFGVFPLEMI